MRVPWFPWNRIAGFPFQFGFGFGFGFRVPFAKANIESAEINEFAVLGPLSTVQPSNSAGECLLILLRYEYGDWARWQLGDDERMVKMLDDERCWVS